MNPSSTCLINNTWCFEILLTYNPTYINMELNICNLGGQDFVTSNFLNITKLNMILGPYLNFPLFGQEAIDTTNRGSEVWFPSSNNNHLSSAIYKFLNNKNMKSFILWLAKTLDIMHGSQSKIFLFWDLSRVRLWYFACS